MENNFISVSIKQRSDEIINNLKENLYSNKQCIAAYLWGSASHDKLWEWSDIQVVVVLDDGYTGKLQYILYENEMYVNIDVYTMTRFKTFISTVRVDDYKWKGLSKIVKLFSKDILLDELFEEAFYIGEVDKQKEMLLGFSGAVYYLNKAEKNFYIKDNLDNTIYFIPQIVENIAWIEIMKNKQIPEREIIPQAKRLNNEIFSKIYDPLFYCNLDKKIIKEILDNCVDYLKHNTQMIYEPIISYMEKNGSLEGFRYITRPHGFGINYDWLVRCGIAKRYGIAQKVPFIKNTVYRLGYMLNKK